MELEVCQVSKRCGGKTVLNQVSFSAESGKVFGILGKKDAGKTTILRILMRLSDADSGTVLINGKSINYANTTICYLSEKRDQYQEKEVTDLLLSFQRKRPEILLFDEPFFGMKPESIRTVKTIINEMTWDGALVIIASEQAELLDGFCDRIAILNNGEIAACGDIYRLKREYYQKSRTVGSLRELYEEIAGV